MKEKTVGEFLDMVRQVRESVPEVNDFKLYVQYVKDGKQEIAPFNVMFDVPAGTVSLQAHFPKE